jgi:hypothetical protein
LDNSITTFRYLKSPSEPRDRINASRRGVVQFQSAVSLNIEKDFSLPLEMTTK